MTQLSFDDLGASGSRAGRSCARRPGDRLRVQPPRAGAGHRRARRPSRCSSSPAPGRARPRLMAAAGGLAGRQRLRRARPGARPDLHPQGGRRAVRTASAALPGPAPKPCSGRDAPARRRADGRHLPLLRGPAGREHGLRTGSSRGAAAHRGRRAGSSPTRRCASTTARRCARSRSARPAPPRGARPGRRAGRAPADPDDIATFTARPDRAMRGAPTRPRKDACEPVQDVLDRQRAPARPAAAGRGVRASARRRWRRWTSATSCAGRPPVARDHPEVGDAERDRFKVVLLDEYQDTSAGPGAPAAVAVRRHGHPVTAVGDPCQSIYGWRGASAGTLDRFPPLPRADGDPAEHRTLASAGATRPQILAVANRCPSRCAAAARRCRRSPPAPDRTSPESPATGAGRVRRGRTWTRRPGSPSRSTAPGRTFEADARPAPDGGGAGPGPVADPRRSNGPCASAACRSRWSASVACSTPPRSATSSARCRSWPTRRPAPPCCGCSPAPRWRIGPRDVVALYRRAPARCVAWRPAAAARRRGEPGVEEPELGGGERLDDACWPRRWTTSARRARSRPRAAAGCALFRDELRGLRGRLDQSLPDLVADIAQTIGLDVEVAVSAAGHGQPGAGPGPPRRDRRRGGPVRRGVRGRHAVGVPRLPGRGRGGGARASPRATSRWSTAPCRS